MGFLRVLKSGVVFSLRSKRILIFIIFFLVLSGVTAYAMNEIAREDRDLLLQQKAVVLETNWQNNTVTQDDSNVVDITNHFRDMARDVVVITYIHIPALNLRIFGAPTDNAWANTIVQPDEITSGRYVKQAGTVAADTYEAVVSQDQIQNGAGPSGSVVSNILSVGSVQQISHTTGEIRFKVVGTFEKTPGLAEGELWVVVSEVAFDELRQTLGLTPANTYVYQIIIVAKGYSETVAAAVLEDATDNTEDILDDAVGYVSGSNWQIKDQPDINKIRGASATTDIILVIGLVGSPIVALLYAFIISRFRTREIAVLKAVGYSNANVQIMLLTEIGMVSIAGYLLSIFGLQLVFAVNSWMSVGTTYVPPVWNPLDLANPLPSWTAVITFLVVVVSNILGFILISRRSISVRPVELFRTV